MNYPAPRGIARYSPGIGTGLEAIADALRVMQGLKFDYLINKARLEQAERMKSEEREYAETQETKQYERNIDLALAQIGGELKGKSLEQKLTALSEFARQQQVTKSLQVQEEQKFKETEAKRKQISDLFGKATFPSIETFETTLEAGQPDYSKLTAVPPKPTGGETLADRFVDTYIDPNTGKMSDIKYRYTKEEWNKSEFPKKAVPITAPREKAVMSPSEAKYEREVLLTNPQFANLMKKMNYKKGWKILDPLLRDVYTKEQALQHLINTNFPNAPEYTKALGMTNKEIMETYPDVVVTIENLRRAGPTVTIPGSEEIITTPDGLRWKVNPDGSYTQVE